MQPLARAFFVHQDMVDGIMVGGCVEEKEKSPGETGNKRGSEARHF